MSITAVGFISIRGVVRFRIGLFVAVEGWASILERVSLFMGGFGCRCFGLGIRSILGSVCSV